MGTDFYQLSILPFAGIIIKICRAYTNSQEDFEGYYQEVCLQIWRSKDNFNNESVWSTWIYRKSQNIVDKLQNMFAINTKVILVGSLIMLLVMSFIGALFLSLYICCLLAPLIIIAKNELKKSANVSKG